MKRTPIGSSDFKEIIGENRYYVDKTLLVKHIIDGSKISLLCRPRRFGKTLNLSLLRYFLERTPDEQKAERWSLFAGLEIASDPQLRPHFGRYPVIALSFKDVKTKRWDHCLAALRRTLADAFEEHEALLPGLGLRESELFRRVLLGNAEAAELWGALRLLTNRRGLLCFDVGVGKTYTALATLARARQEGWCRRPVVLVPNSIVWKWHADFARVLPDYRVAVIGSRQKLVARGEVFRSRSDTEVVLRGYRAFGEDVLQRLRGVGRLRLGGRGLGGFCGAEGGL
jgi:hypothetical protein